MLATDCTDFTEKISNICEIRAICGVIL
ncbi:MAG: hypothetical protein H6Q07_1225, partial [Acidobacteria bacterium]|nr:hypothetical protein [Acidobacteriota bacterium]